MAHPNYPDSLASNTFQGTIRGIDIHWLPTAINNSLPEAMSSLQKPQALVKALTEHSMITAAVSLGAGKVVIHSAPHNFTTNSVTKTTSYEMQYHVGGRFSGGSVTGKRSAHVFFPRGCNWENAVVCGWTVTTNLKKSTKNAPATLDHSLCWGTYPAPSMVGTWSSAAPGSRPAGPASGASGTSATATSSSGYGGYGTTTTGAGGYGSYGTIPNPTTGGYGTTTSVPLTGTGYSTSASAAGGYGTTPYSTTTSATPSSGYGGYGTTPYSTTSSAAPSSGYGGYSTTPYPATSSALTSSDQGTAEAGGTEQSAPTLAGTSASAASGAAPSGWSMNWTTVDNTNGQIQSRWNSSTNKGDYQRWNSKKQQWKPARWNQRKQRWEYI